MSIFVGNLPSEATKEVLLEKFSQFGDCELNHFVSSIKGKFALVFYNRDSHGTQAVSVMKGFKLAGKELSVSWSQNRMAAPYYFQNLNQRARSRSPVQKMKEEVKSNKVTKTIQNSKIEFQKSQKQLQKSENSETTKEKQSIIKKENQIVIQNMQQTLKSQQQTNHQLSLQIQLQENRDQQNLTSFNQEEVNSALVSEQKKVQSITHGLVKQQTTNQISSLQLPDSTKKITSKSTYSQQIPKVPQGTQESKTPIEGQSFIQTDGSQWKLIKYNKQKQDSSIVLCLACKKKIKKVSVQAHLKTKTHFSKISI